MIFAVSISPRGTLLCGWKYVVATPCASIRGSLFTEFLDSESMDYEDRGEIVFQRSLYNLLVT